MNVLRREFGGKVGQPKTSGEVPLVQALSIAVKNDHVGPEVLTRHLARKTQFADDLVKAYVGLMNDGSIAAGDAVCAVLQSNIESLTEEQRHQVNEAYKNAFARNGGRADNTETLTIDSQTSIAPQYLLEHYKQATDAIDKGQSIMGPQYGGVQVRVEIDEAAPQLKCA